jgi:integrase/recombinase XerD
MSSPSRVRLSGPLVGHVAGFRADLEAQGYRRNVVANQLQLFAHVSRWLENKGLGPQHLTGERVAEFLCARRSAGYTLWVSEKGVAPLLTYLRSVGVAPALEAPVPVASADRVLEEFRFYLVHERGLAPGTVAADVHVARLFLATRVRPDLGLEALTPPDVIAFVTAQCGQRSAAYVTTGLRAFLRFCHLTGRTPRPLVGAVPRVACWRLAKLRRRLPPTPYKRCWPAATGAQPTDGATSRC